MLAFGVHTAAMQELHFRILLRDFEYVWVEITEGRRKHNLRSILVDHIAHRFLDRCGFWHARLFNPFNPVELLNAGTTLCMSLVVAVVVLWPDVDEAHHHFVGRSGNSGADGERHHPDYCR